MARLFYNLWQGQNSMDRKERECFATAAGSSSSSLCAARAGDRLFVTVARRVDVACITALVMAILLAAQGGTVFLVLAAVFGVLTAFSMGISAIHMLVDAPIACLPRFRLI